MHVKYTYNLYFIYMIKNLINKKCYVGFHATNTENDKYFGSGKLLKASIKKYGKEYFVKGIIEYVKPEEWKEKETFWIKEMKSHVSEGGYNITFGGDGSLGARYKQKKVGRKLSLQHRQNIQKVTAGKNNGMFGKHHSEETRAKIGLKNLGNIWSEERKAYISSINSGKKYTGELYQQRYIKIQCPCCNKLVDKANFKRWHGENCKQKIII